MKIQATKHTHIKRLGAVVVLKPHGDLMGGEETDELGRLILELDAENVRCLVINLVDVGMVSSLGLSRLITAHVRFSKRKAHVNLCNVDKKINAVFVITKLTLVFPVFASEEEAIAGCAGDPE